MIMRVTILVKAAIVHSRDNYRLMMPPCKKELPANKFVFQTLWPKLMPINVKLKGRRSSMIHRQTLSKTHLSQCQAHRATPIARLMMKR